MWILSLFPAGWEEPALGQGVTCWPPLGRLLRLCSMVGARAELKGKKRKEYQDILKKKSSRLRPEQLGGETGPGDKLEMVLLVHTCGQPEATHTERRARTEQGHPGKRPGRRAEQRRSAVGQRRN